MTQFKSSLNKPTQPIRFRDAIAIFNKPQTNRMYPVLPFPLPLYNYMSEECIQVSKSQIASLMIGTQHPQLRLLSKFQLHDAAQELRGETRGK